MFKLKSILLEASRDELAAKLTAAFKAGPAETRKFLDSPDGMSDTVRKDLLLAPEMDGNDPDDAVEVGSVTGAKASGFKPTQQEIDLMKSVSFPLGSAGTLANAIENPETKGIVVSGDFIIDGHHRWSGIQGIAGTDATLSGKDVDWPGTTSDEMLAAAQIAIAAKLGPDKKIPSQAEPFDTNISGKDAQTIAKMALANVNKKTDPNAPGPLMNDAMMEDLTDSNNANAKIVANWLGLETVETDADALRRLIASRVGSNLAALPSNEAAPERKDMPQFDDKVGGPDIDDVTPALTGKAGGYNISPPFVKDGIIKLKDLLGR